MIPSGLVANAPQLMQLFGLRENGLGEADNGGGGGFGGGGMGPQNPQPSAPPQFLQNLMALYGQMGRANNQSPIGLGHFGLPYDPSQPPPFMPPGVPLANTGGNTPPMMQAPMTGGSLPASPMGPAFNPPQGFAPFGMNRPGPMRVPQPGQGYDGSGINPGGNFYPQMSAMRRSRNLGLGRR